MEEQPSPCAASINSIASLSVSRRDLVRLRDRIDYLEVNLSSIENDQLALQKKISGMTREVKRLKMLFDSLFSEQIINVMGAEEVDAELSEERLLATQSAGQITLGISEVTREQILSVMDAIRRVSEDCQGSAPRDMVRERAEKIGITGEDFEEILGRLRRGGALVESGGKIKLI